MMNLGWQPGRRRLRRAEARWLVLGLLVFGVGALAVFGGADDEDGGARELLMTVSDASLQEIMDGKTAEQMPDKTADITAEKTAEGQQEAYPSAVTAAGDNAAENTANMPDNTADDMAEQEVRDDAPEPWVGDAVLAAEAGLLNMLPPLDGAPSRAYGFGYDATFGDYRFHQGVDWQAEPGTAVQVPLAGEVVLLDDPFYGTGVELQHEGALCSRYYGIKPTEGLQNGQSVNPGEKLGEVTASPTFEDGQPPHLHWEIWLDDELIDPADYQAEFGVAN